MRASVKKGKKDLPIYRGERRGQLKKKKKRERGVKESRNPTETKRKNHRKSRGKKPKRRA